MWQAARQAAVPRCLASMSALQLVVCPSPAQQAGGQVNSIACVRKEGNVVKHRPCVLSSFCNSQDEAVVASLSAAIDEAKAASKSSPVQADIAQRLTLRRELLLVRDMSRWFVCHQLLVSQRTVLPSCRHLFSCLQHLLCCVRLPSINVPALDV